MWCMDKPCKPKRSITPKTENDRIDRKAVTIARNCCAGVIDDCIARKALADLAVRSRPGLRGASFIASRSSLQPNQQEFVDLQSSLDELIAKKVLVVDGHGLDIEQIANGKSLCGWASSMSISAARSELRNVRVRTRRIVQDPNINMSGPSVEDTYPSLEDQHFDNETSESLIDEFRSITRGKADAARVKTRADILRRAFGLPDTEKISYSEDAKRKLLTRLEQDPSIPRKWAAGLPTGKSRQVDRQIAQIFQCWKPCDRERLADLDYRVGFALAVDAVC